mgnify:CR=1 FL=1
MFTHNYNQLDGEIRGIINKIKVPSIQEVKDILEKSKTDRISLNEIARLLEVEEQEQRDLIRNFVLSEFRKEKNISRHIAPIYLSSYCLDLCKYCNFSFKNMDIERTRLELSDLEEEINEVLSAGNRVIEFTLATDIGMPPKELSKYISKTKELLNNEEGSGVLLCSTYFSEEEYLLLKNSGLWGMVQWDETLDRKIYDKWHGNSPKKSKFEKRIDNHDRAIQTGLEVATGCLFGLGDYRYDVLMQIAKARYLEQEYGTLPFVFGTARLKIIGGRKLYLENEVNDEQYELSLMVYKIAEPKIARWLQTREKPELNMRNIVNDDIYTFQCGDVKPGGYKINRRRIDSCSGGQFMVNEMTKEEFEQELKKINFNVDYSWIE